MRVFKKIYEKFAYLWNDSRFNFYLLFTCTRKILITTEYDQRQRKSNKNEEASFSNMYKSKVTYLLCTFVFGLKMKMELI